MRSLYLYFFIAVFSITFIPQAVSSEASPRYPYQSVQFENNRIKVFHAYHEPFEETAMFLSTPGLNVWLTDADFEIILPNGQVFQRFTYKAGDTNWVPVEYRVALRNLSAAPISFYHIEFKEDDQAITGQTSHQAASKAPANNDVLKATTAHIFTAASGEIPYRLYSPAIEADKEYPLVLFLHGWGERGNDNVKQIAHGVPELIDYVSKNQPAFLIAPQHGDFAPWLNVPVLDVDRFELPQDPSLSLQQVIELVKDFIENQPVDKSRIYVTGLSMGGFGTWDILVREPELFAAAVPVASGSAENVAERIKHIPVWAMHGGNDTVIDPEFSRNTIQALNDAGANPTYEEFPEAGHKAEDWRAFYSHAKMLHWLFQQKKTQLTLK